MKRKKQIKQLAWREYLPLAATATMWAVILLAIGHADTARLLATVVMVRAAQYATRIATSTALRRRIGASRPVQLQAKRLAFNLQTTALLLALLAVVLLTEAMKAIGQDQIASFMPFVALGMPARYWRLADVRTASPYFRLALAGSGLCTVALAWALGWPATLLALAFGAREWIAYLVLRWWPREPRPPSELIDQPLHFGEVARYTVILGRRLVDLPADQILARRVRTVGQCGCQNRSGTQLAWPDGALCPASSRRFRRIERTDAGRSRCSGPSEWGAGCHDPVSRPVAG